MDDYFIAMTMALIMEQTESKSQVFLDLNSLFDLDEYDNMMLGVLYDELIAANKNYDLNGEYLKIIKMSLDIK